MAMLATLVALTTPSTDNTDSPRARITRAAKDTRSMNTPAALILSARNPIAYHLMLPPNMC